MKLIAGYTVAAAFLCQTASASDVNCQSSHQSGAAVNDMINMKADVLSFKGLYRISGEGTSNFAESGASAMTLSRNTKSKPLGSTHLSPPTVADAMQEIIDCCTIKHFDPCIGETDVTGNQGDPVIVNMWHN